MFQLQRISCIINNADTTKGSLYLGDIFGAQDTKTLSKLGIKAVLTCAASTDLKYPPQIVPHHMIIPAQDTPSYNLGRFFNKGIAFIQKHIQHTNVYVHCFAGVSRSGAMVVAYIMKTRKLNLKKALNFVRKRRGQVFPNTGFLKQLM